MDFLAKRRSESHNHTTFDLGTEIVRILNGTALKGLHNSHDVDGAALAVDCHFNAGGCIRALLGSTRKTNAMARASVPSSGAPIETLSCCLKDASQTLVLDVAQTVLQSVDLGARCQFVHE